MDKSVKIVIKIMFLCHLPIKRTLHPKMAVMLEEFIGFVCGSKKKSDNHVVV